MAQRVLFTFDPDSLERLRQVKEKGGFSSLATAVRESIYVSSVLQNQVAGGFTEVIVRNPKTKQEKVLVIPSLERVSGKVKL